MNILIGHTNQISQLLAQEALPGREGLHDDILAFGNGYTQVAHTPGMTWAQLLSNLPGGWTPDVYLHWSPEYNAVPAGLEKAECLTVGVFGDWNLGGTALRCVGDVFDVLVADKPGSEVLKRAGFSRVISSLLWGYNPELHRQIPGFDAPSKKDIDLLMIGNFNHEIQQDRAKWLSRVAKLSPQYRVVLTTGIHGEEYTRMTNRAKIVFNRSIRGELNMRAYEATACGALHFMERGNAEFSEVFRDGVSGVLYGDDNFEALIAHYLAPANVSEREQIAHNGTEAVLSHTFAHHLGTLLNDLDTEVQSQKSGGEHRSKERNAPSDTRLLTQWLLSPDKAVLPQLDAALETALQNAETAHARGELISLHAVGLCLQAAHCPPSEEKERLTKEAFSRFAEAFETNPTSLVARYNYGYTLLMQGFTETGVSVLRETLARIDNDSEAHFTGLTLPRVQDGSYVQGEKIHLAHAPGSEGWTEEMQHWLRSRVLLTLSETAYAQNDFLTSWNMILESSLQNPVQIPILYSKARAAHAMGRVEDALRGYRQTTQESPFHWKAWEEWMRFLIDLNRAEEAVPLLEDLEVQIRACTYYAPHRPAILQLLREARQHAQNKHTLPDVKRFLAFPNWNENGDWREIARAFTRKYKPTDNVLLMLRAAPHTTPLAGVLITNLQYDLLHECHFPAESVPAITILSEELSPEEEWKLFHFATEVIESSELNPLRRAQAEAANLAVTVLGSGLQKPAENLTIEPLYSRKSAA
ncbi:MAG: glycosyltransferase [Chthonomonadaceae bacterium]|nr:glycosyltransferase [Chthonomonadaceae bacterium]